MKFLFALLALAAPTAGVAANAPVATTRAQPRSGRPGYTLFARVEPVRVLVVRAASTGTLKDLNAKPGDHVRAGERLAGLSGPTYAATLGSARAALQAARKSVRLAHDRLQTTQSRYPVLSNRLALDQAKRGLASARAGLATAQARYAEIEAAGTIAAPAAGTVSDVLRSDGERVAPGDGIVDIHPAGSLWLRGAAYGEQIRAVHAGMHGCFQPTGGGNPIAVRVTGLIPADANDGLGIGFAPVAHAPRWFDGESGLVTLQGSRSGEPAVPTSALVLDHGHWWVVEKTGHTFKPVRVKPDGSRGGWTWIATGIKPGDQVVFSGAYRIFHRAFAKHYSGD